MILSGATCSSGTPNSLEDPNITDLDVGSGGGWPEVDHLYVSANGGGLHDVAFTW